MSVQLNHTIVWCRDKQKSATFLTDILGLRPPIRFGPFLVVELSNGASLDFHETDGEIASQHYAFLLGEGDSTKSSAASASDGWSTGLTPASTAPAKLTATTAGAGFTSRTPMVISSRSSPAPTALAGSGSRRSSAALEDA